MLVYLELNQEKEISVQQICDLLNLTPQKFERCLKDLQIDLLQFEENPKVYKTDSFIHSQNLTTYIVSRLRLIYLEQSEVFLWLREMLEEDLSLKQFSKKNFISLPSAYAKTSQLKKFLVQKGLKIKNGRLIGDELKIRSFYFCLFFESYEGLSFPFSEELHKRVRQYVNFLIQTYHFRVVNIQLAKLEIFLAVTFCRLKNHYGLSSDEDYFQVNVDFQKNFDYVVQYGMKEFIEDKKISVDREMKYFLFYLQGEQLVEEAVMVRENLMEKLDNVSRNIARKIFEQLALDNQSLYEDFLDRLVQLNQFHYVFTFWISSFTSKRQLHYFFEICPYYSTTIFDVLNQYKNELPFEESLLNHLFCEYLFLLDEFYSFVLVEEPVYVYVCFSLGQTYTNFIVNQIKNFKNLNICVEKELTSKIDIYISDRAISPMNSNQIIWKKPPTATDWRFFGDKVIEVRREKSVKEVNKKNAIA